jgi:hypothetical protein
MKSALEFGELDHIALGDRPLVQGERLRRIVKRLCSNPEPYPVRLTDNQYAVRV